MPIDGRSAHVRSRHPSTTGESSGNAITTAVSIGRSCQVPCRRGDPRADEIRRLERGWWRRLPLILVRPGEVFAELRDSSDEQAEALSEPMVAVTILAGTAMFLSTATAGQLFDDSEFDWLLIAVEAFFAGVLVAAQNYWLGGAALLLGLRSLGSMARYRTARQIVGLSTAPFVLALVVVWPLRIAIFGGDLFRSGGSDEGTTALRPHLHRRGLRCSGHSCSRSSACARSRSGASCARSARRRSPPRCSACCWPRRSSPSAAPPTRRARAPPRGWSTCAAPPGRRPCGPRRRTSPAHRGRPSPDRRTA